MRCFNVGDRAKPPVLCIMGATASGKTAAAMAAAHAAPCHVISVDSALVYRGMDIGTAKPTAEELDQVPHALIDLCAPEESYSAARFLTDAVHEVNHAHANGLLPILVGGTNLYFRALLHGLHDMPSADSQVRAAIQERANTMGWEALHAELAVRDAESAMRIHPNDAQRIQRALELIATTGKTPAELYAQAAPPASDAWAVQSIGVAPAPLPFDGASSVAALNERIGRRFEQMMKAGFMDEVATLRNRPGLTADHPSMRAVGYRQVWQCLDGELTPEQAMERGVIATRQFAKRQRTWLRKEPNVQWFSTEEAPGVARALAARLSGA